MSEATSVAASARNRLPLVVYFEGDVAARTALNSTEKFMRVPLTTAAPQLGAGVVLVTTSEQVLTEHWEALRGHGSLRVVALSDERFEDPRMDGAVFAYLPRQTPLPLIERTLENAFSHMHLTAIRRAFNQRLAEVTREIDELNRVGVALSGERDTAKLLEMILSKSRQITGADAGSLYLAEDVDESGMVRHLRFALAQNDTVPIEFSQSTMEISARSIAGYVAMTGKAVNIAEAYNLPPEVPYAVNRKFDEESGYRTKSILAVPMRAPNGDVVGVVQLINSKREPGRKLQAVGEIMAQTLPFTQRHQDLAESLASQAAVTLQNSRLLESIQNLFEGFVRASVNAIEARDPITSGHSFRVANLTVALAEAVNRAESGPFARVHFTPEQIKELRYASLLHDFGKVGVREEVLVKADKLYPHQVELIRRRFQFAKRAQETEILRQALHVALESGRNAYQEKAAELNAQLARQWAELDDAWHRVEVANVPSLMPEGEFEHLRQIAKREFMDVDGERRPLLKDDEVQMLSIRKGSLDEHERQQIESHVAFTFKFLSEIPWTKEFRAIPQIARAHHEKLNGKGYPYKLSERDIPIQARMMAIADIFDGLAAVDRPYKKAVSTERALAIMRELADNGEIEGDLLDLFVSERVHEHWRVESNAPANCD